MANRETEAHRIWVDWTKPTVTETLELTWIWLTPMGVLTPIDSILPPIWASSLLKANLSNVNLFCNLHLFGSRSSAV